MANTITITGTVNLAKSTGGDLAAGSATYVVTQTDADGKFSSATLKLSTSGTLVVLPKGNISFGEAYLFVQNLSSTTGEDVIMAKESGGTNEIGRIKPGGVWMGVRTADVYANSAAGTPTIKVTYIQV